jgi:zinc protease
VIDANRRRLTDDVTRERLPNGLTILVKESHAAPVVALNVWVKAGYFNEEDDEVGIAHVIEHMFFKGTPSRPSPDQIAREVKSLGGELNAGTYYDFTHYYFTLPAGAFSQGLDIQSDALMNPLIDPAELSRELEAIIQEARRKMDNPGAFAAEKLNELAFRVHRIRRWRIGHEEMLRDFTRDKLMDFYRRHYCAENVILCVVGDVETRDVLDAARRRLGSMPARSGARRSSPPEPPQEDFRHRVLSGDIKRAHLFIGFRTVPLFDPDDLPVRILATILGKGRSSRLFQEVKENRGLVEGIGSGTEVFADLGTLTVSAELEPGQVRDAATAILGVLAGIGSQGPFPEEILKARSAVESQYYLAQSDVTGVSSNLAYYESLGDYHLADEFVRKLQEVTPEAVLRAARSYLVPGRASFLAYVPETDASYALDEAEIRRRFLTPAQDVALPSPAQLPEAIRRPPAPSAFSRAAREPVRLSLPGGATLLVEENPRLPVANVVVLFRGGRSQETPQNTGISRLTLATMAKGTPLRDAHRIAIEIESFGCSLERVFDDDYLGFSIGILSRFLPGGLDLLLDVMRNPGFPVTELERERKVQLAAIEALQDQSMGYALNLFREAAYAGHPYALPAYGAAGVLAGLSREDLLRWHRRTFRPDQMVVAVAGDLAAESVREMVAEKMAGWRADGDAPGDREFVAPPAGIVRRIETRKRTQTFQILGFPACDLRSEEKYPLDLLQNVVSGLGGVFFEAIRGKRGLAYVVAAMNFAKRLGGSFVVYLGTSPDKEDEAREILLEEVNRIRSEGLKPEEIARARAFTLGTYPMLLQTNLARALSYAAAELQEKGMEEVAAYPSRIRAVTDEAVTEAARRFLTPDRYALGILRGV